MAATATVLDRHLESFGEGDLDGILADYAADAVVVADGDVFVGHEEIRPFFEALLAEFDAPDVEFELGERVVHDEFAYITWRAETPEQVYEYATDTFVVRDGEIAAQTIGTVTTANA